MTVKEQLFLTHHKSWYPKKDDLDELIETFPYLEKILKQPAGELSGGEKMLVAFSMIIQTNAKLLILDEPFNALHKNNVNYFQRILDDIKNNGTSILIIDHTDTLKTDKIYELGTVEEFGVTFE